MTSASQSSSPNPPSLSELKRQIRGKYLGKFGIHAVGVRSNDNAIRVYATPGGKGQDQGLAQIRKEIEPCKLDVVFEERPTIGAG
jgi:hypothetical protein